MIDYPCLRFQAQGQTTFRKLKLYSVAEVLLGEPSTEAHGQRD